MAQSIKLGSDTYLDASGVFGFKGTIGSSDDLNMLCNKIHSGLYYFNGTPANRPSTLTNQDWGLLIVIATAITGTGFVEQVCFFGGNIYTRRLLGNPATWSSWYRFTGTTVT